MSRTASPAVKICGVCRPEDAALAVEAGASYIGVIRVTGSARTRSVEVARSVIAAAAGARTVGVYVDAPVATIVQEAGALGLEVVQLHGAEPPSAIAALQAEGLEVWKVVKPAAGEALVEAAARYGDADLLLVEGRSDRGHGGVGARFPWDEVAGVLERLPPGTRLGVGGGLTPDNVAGAVRRLRPVLVDVSSGVEAELCRKDPGKVRSFVAAAQGAGTAGSETDMHGEG